MCLNVEFIGKGIRNWELRAVIQKELAEIKMHFYSAKVHTNSLMVMNTALLHPCHVFVQLSYIPATWTHCLRASWSRGYPT